MHILKQCKTNKFFIILWAVCIKFKNQLMDCKTQTLYLHHYFKKGFICDCLLPSREAKASSRRPLLTLFLNEKVPLGTQQMVNRAQYCFSGKKFNLKKIYSNSRKKWLLHCAYCCNLDRLLARYLGSEFQKLLQKQAKEKWYNYRCNGI